MTLELKVDEEITLRQFCVEDAKVIFDLIDRNREHLSQHDDDTAGKYPLAGFVFRSIACPKNPERLRMGIWANEEFTGSINLTPVASSTSFEVGYYLGKEYQGRGYMTRAVNRLVKYAFEEKKATQVFANVHPDNSASMAVLERAGFTRLAKRKDGQIYFSICKLTTDC
ncbi:GNAT family N-acetyltransferase [Candidatus Woesearchaeota archaeon]|nr:GNAT family N-acetyltransferase [Candidatus Woesearchaeota archaeon]MBW3006383.1 GNAT family N-acetyltransferase [Candidatus Woesearchaeota archaeon]